MKKLLCLCAAIALFGFNDVKAQDYEIAVGLGLDFGSGFTFVGPSGKFALSDVVTVQGELMFESGVTGLTGLIAYNGSFDGAEGLSWFAGGGVSALFFGNGFGTEFALRPTAGLEYKIADVPLAFSFDWRPFIGLGDINNEIGAFGLGVRYVIQ